MTDFLLAQNFAMGYFIMAMGIGLGVLAVIIPRPRKRFDPFPKKAVKRTVRHADAGSLRQTSRYGLKK